MGTDNINTMVFNSIFRHCIRILARVELRDRVAFLSGEMREFMLVPAAVVCLWVAIELAI